MYESEKLLNVMEQILGPEIAANPVWNIRPKTPGVSETDNPWHQGTLSSAMILKSKKDNKIQESIQSSTTPVPGYQNGKVTKAQ